MKHLSPIQSTASSLPARKITRKELAAHCRLSTRTIDNLTRGGVLPHFRFGGAVRYDLAEVEATLQERFHFAAGVKESRCEGARGRAGCPQPAAPKPTTAETAPTSPPPSFDIPIDSLRSPSGLPSVVCLAPLGSDFVIHPSAQATPSA